MFDCKRTKLTSTYNERIQGSRLHKQQQNTTNMASLGSHPRHRASRHRYKTQNEPHLLCSIFISVIVIVTCIASQIVQVHSDNSLPANNFQFNNNDFNVNNNNNNDQAEPDSDFGSRLQAHSSAANPDEPNDGPGLARLQFAARQGLLVPPGAQTGGDFRRPQPRPQPSNQQLQRQQLPSQQQQPAEAAGRFQRLRPPQPQQPGGLGPDQAPGVQMRPLAQQQQQQFNGNPQLRPTQGAFDLSSLASLANQLGNPQQQQPTFNRRIPTAPQQPQQQNRAQQQPGDSGANLGVTELPQHFVHQVFRTPNAPELSSQNNNGEAPNRPTPPPLFVPGQPGRGQQLGVAQANGANRQRQPQLNVETSGGFAPIGRPGGSNDAQPVFFEPSLSHFNRQNPQSQRVQFQAQPPQQPQPQPQQQQPSQAQAQAQNRRAPPRRPGQRQQVPTLPQLAPNDVARLPAQSGGFVPIAPTSNSLPATPLAPQEFWSTTTTTSSTPTSSFPTTTSTTSTTPVSTSTFNSAATTAATTTTSSAAPPTTTLPIQRRPANQQPPRSSANIFALTSVATSAPSSFSPSLPINAAVAASGGRRRIPVRPATPSSSIGARQAPLAPTTTTASSSSTAASSTSTMATPLRSPAPVSIRKPEIEEFYETISSGNSNGASAPSASGATTQIDAFGTSLNSNIARLPSSSSSSSSSGNSANTDAPNSGDFYGSRLPIGGTNANSPVETSSVGSDSSSLAPPVGSVASASSPVPSSNNQAGNEAPFLPIAAPNSPQLAPQPQVPNPNAQSAVLVPITYTTTLTYLTTVLHGTHTLETSHESYVTSTELATLNAQLMDQIENKRPIIEPTATLAVSSKTKGKGTTVINLKSAVSAFNQELVDALGVAAGVPVGGPAASSVAPAPFLSEVGSEASLGSQQPRPSQTLDISDLDAAKKQLVTEVTYLYTIRPALGGDTPPKVTSRTEVLGLRQLNQAELQRELSGESSELSVDSNGIIKLSNSESDQNQPQLLNLGSATGSNGASVTEVNVNLASYIKLADVANVMVQLKPSALAGGRDPAATNQNNQNNNNRKLLETSFSLELALDKLAGDDAQLQSQAGQPTPTLDSQGILLRQTSRPDDLLRAPAGVSGAPGAASATANRQASANRSQLRSRVASSRLRTGSRQPSVIVSSSVLTNGGLEATVAPSGSRSSTGGRPFKSRIVTRPSNATLASAQAKPLNETLSLAANATTASLQSAIQQPVVRSSKPRFVVVTRTGQFGVRASAISSLQAQQDASAAISVSPIVEVASSSSLPASSSRLLKPKIRGGSSSTSTTSTTTTTTSTTTQKPTGADVTTNQPTSDYESSSSSSQPTTEAQQPTTSSSTTSSSSTPQPLPASSPSDNPQPGPVAATGDNGGDNKLAVDPSASVVVTYFTTTTHTIPFTINSETIFTTIEETNSRIATELMRDLSSGLIEPSQVVGSQMHQTEAPQMPSVPQSTTTTTTTANNNIASLNQETTTSSAKPQPQTTTTKGNFDLDAIQNQPTSPSPAPQNQPGQQVEPSFVVALNTRTYFTTFTYFTTYSAGSATPTIKSSESTTSQIVTETVTSILDAASAGTNQILATPSMQLDSTAAPTIYSSPQPGSSSPAATTTTPRPAGSLKDQADELDQSVAVSSSSASSEVPSPTINLVDSLATTSTSVLSDQQPTVMVSQVDTIGKIARTKSMYTTLTHYITFYSGTKTHLSTIQEISPTVVTEYVDRTQIEQLDKSSNSWASVRPQESLGIQVTPTAVLPNSLSTQPPQPQPQPTDTNDQPSIDQSTATTTASSKVTTTTPSAPKLSDLADSFDVSEDNSKPSSASTSSQAPSTQSPNASEAPQGDLEAKSSGNPTPSGSNIIELTDLISSNSSQNGRVALPGHLGAAIKDIVQLLAGNKTNQAFGGLPVLASSPALSSTTSTSTSSTPTEPITSDAAITTRRPNRVFGNKQQQQLQPSSSVAPLEVPSSARTPELSTAVISSEDSTSPQSVELAGRQRPKTVWSGAQSTVFMTSIEPTTRMVTMTTTKVYYTSDSPPFTVTSTLTSVYPPRTFVSTISGTRTQVNQVGASTQVPVLANQSVLVGASTDPAANKNKSAGSQQQVSNNRQDSQAASSRLAVESKQRKQQQQQQAELQLKEKRIKEQQQQQQQRELLAAKKAKESQQVAGKNSDGSVSMANIAQCQPTCKEKLNEICKFTPASDSQGAQGSFSCGCRPGYQLLPVAGAPVVQGTKELRRQCQEVQSYVVLLRLIQIGDQQVNFKRELMDKSSQDYRQMSRVIKDHVKRAYMTSDLTRDRFVSAGIINYARSMSGAQQVGVAATSKAASPTNSSDNSLNAGLFVNLTIQLQPSSSVGTQLDMVNESSLKEELTKKLNLRQAAALAASQSSASSSSPSSVAPALGDMGALDSQADNSTASGAMQSDAMSVVEALPNPNALFLADVEQVSDLDECAHPTLNDCHEAAQCINEPGSYRCDCRDYPDLNPSNAGRQCGNEIKSCDFCNNRGDCIRVPSLLAGHGHATNNTSSSTSSHHLYNHQLFATVCQCNPFYLGRRCDINGWVLATVVPTTSILLIVSICLIIYFCRRWRRRSAIHHGFRNMGTFGPNLIGGTLDRKAMLESSSESSDSHQRSREHNLRAAMAGLYGEVNGAMQSDPSGSSNESSPRQMVRNQLVDPTSGHYGHQIDARQGGPAGCPASASQQQQSAAAYCQSIPQQIVIPRARHNQVNYAVHRGQVYMW